MNSNMITIVERVRARFSLCNMTSFQLAGSWTRLKVSGRHARYIYSE